jgi:uroporphyrinogen III methyltransferase/synthase
MPLTKGKVYLIGAGPGDPGLITLKAVNCLAQADVVVYDHLASSLILDYAPAGAEKIYAGKTGGVILPSRTR